MDRILAEKQAEEWAEVDDIQGVLVMDLQEAILCGTVVDFTQPYAITSSEDAKW